MANILDAHFSLPVAAAISQRGIRCRLIGVNIGHQSMSDEEIIRNLHNVWKNSTLITLNYWHFFRRDLVHPRYCILNLDVRNIGAVPEIVQRVYRHPELRTLAKRRGKVIKCTTQNILYFDSLTGPAKQLRYQ
jgi:hypothetical protein